MIKAILFDLDGVLVNTLLLYIKAYDRALKEQDFTFSKKEIVNTCFGKTEETICKNLGIPDKTEQFRKTYFAGINNHLNEGKLFNGVLEILNLCIERQIKLAIISFNYRWYVDKMVKRLNLDKYFKIIIGFDNVKNAKPDPEAAVLACKRLDIRPFEAVVIGDSKSDILMGKAAGCETVLFYTEGYDLFYDLKVLKESSPDKIIKDFKELKEFLLKNRLS